MVICSHQQSTGLDQLQMMLGLSLTQIQQTILENQTLFINECIFCEFFAVKSNKLFIVVAKSISGH